MQDENSKVVRVPISFQFLARIFTNRNAILVERGIPRDARLVDIYRDHEKGILYIVLSHKSFQTVKVGETIPIFDVVIRDLNKINIYK